LVPRLVPLLACLTALRSGLRPLLVALLGRILLRRLVQALLLLGAGLILVLAHKKPLLESRPTNVVNTATTYDYSMTLQAS
jgi:hypothetical protein